MRPVDATALNHGAERYLDELSVLRDEISTAILAISGVSLRMLEESLWRQEVLCISLEHLLQSLGEPALDAATLSRVYSATHALYRLNNTYAELVKQSRASTDLLYTLCRSYKESSFQGGSYVHSSRYSLEV